MSRIELRFHGGPDRGPKLEVGANSLQMDVHINGRPVVDGERYMIRGSAWRLSRENSDGPEGARRFRCKFVA